MEGNTSRCGSAIQVLPSDIGKYLSSFLITAVVVVFISMLISIVQNYSFYHCEFLCQKYSLTRLTWLAWMSRNSLLETSAKSEDSVSATGLETTFCLYGWVLVYELSSCGFESRCSHLIFRYRACFEQGVLWHLGNYRV